MPGKAQQFVPGPVHVLVGFPPDSAGGTGGDADQKRQPEYLGTSEKGVMIETIRHWKPIFADISGTATPFDKLHLGRTAIVTADINRWKEPTYQKLAAYPPGKSSGDKKKPRYGYDEGGDVGTMYLQANKAMTLWLRFPYGDGGIAAAYRDLPGGHRYPGASLLAPETLDPHCGPTTRRLVWHCLRVFKPASADESHRFTLFDHDMDGVDAVIAGE